MDSESVDLSSQPHSKAPDAEPPASSAAKTLDVEPTNPTLSPPHDSTPLFSTSGITSWAKNLRIPQSFVTGTQKAENSEKSGFARFTSNFGLRLSPTTTENTEGTSTISQNGILDSFTKGIVDSSRSAVKAVRVKAHHMVSQNKRRYQSDRYLDGQLKSKFAIVYEGSCVASEPPNSRLPAAVDAIRCVVERQHVTTEPSATVQSGARATATPNFTDNPQKDNLTSYNVEESKLSNGTKSYSKASLSSFGGQTRSRSIGALKGQSGEVKPNLVPESAKVGASDKLDIIHKTNALSLSKDNISDVEEMPSTLHKKREEPTVSHCQPVIISKTIVVPEAAKNGLTFGSINADFGVSMNHTSGFSTDKNSAGKSDFLHGNEDVHQEQIPSNQSAAFAAQGEECPDHQQSPLHMPENPQSPQENDLNGMAHDSHTNFAVPQQLDQLTSSSAAPLYRPIDRDSRLSSVLAFGTATKYDGSVVVISQHFHSPDESENSLIMSTTGATQLVTPPAGMVQSSLGMLSHSVTATVPPNFIPYDHYTSLFYVPPSMHQYLGHGGFPQQPPTGNAIMPPTASAGVKLSLTLYKNIRNVSQIGITSFGPSQKGEFDLDMTYITENIIAMGFPAGDMSSGFLGYVETFLAGFYRNHIEEVIEFFETHHKVPSQFLELQEKYKVYNLCSERLYNAALLKGKVATFPFDDHNCPPIELIKLFCQSAYSWLKEDIENVVVVHCKAGMGRTGLNLRSFDSSHFLQFFPTVEEYNQKRCVDGKALVLPSPMRGSKPLTCRCMLRGFRLHKCPYWVRPSITISNHNGVLFTTKKHPKTKDLMPDDFWINAPRKGIVVFALPGEPGLTELVGDFQIYFHDRHGDFYCWLNTTMIENRTFLDGSDLDWFDKRKLPSPGLQVEIVMIDYDGTLPVKSKANSASEGPNTNSGVAQSEEAAPKSVQNKVSENKDKDDVFSDSEGEENGPSKSRQNQAASPGSSTTAEQITSITRGTEQLTLRSKNPNTATEPKTDGIPNPDSVGASDIKAIAADASVFSFGDDEDYESD
ncbi:LOW QUALITY PROTEIN: hypothetical protein RJ641_011384 [Dillenia turbinata]|uniref:Phosphatidylinositol-3,4,5-trisphosphate 3-phosphatase n=1 Tax=Dillenia turbinata TaxID=194707 RepID=A0AAN8UW29_9MAGN